MTISESIQKWLYDFGEIEIDEKIDTDLLKAQVNTYALAKAPTNIREEFIDGSSLNTEYYTFLTRRTTQFDGERVSNNQFLEKLTEWVEERNNEGILPKLDNKRVCDNIAISSGFYLFETEEENGVYSLTFEIIYRKEK